MRQWKLVLVILAALRGGAQSGDQQYLFSVMPAIERGDWPSAEQQLARGLDQFPRSAVLHNALGIVYRKEGRTDQAIDAFRKALSILPSFTAAQLQLASLEQQQGRKSDAAELFRAAADSTTDFEALVTAGLGLADCADYTGAVRVLSKARAQKPDSPSVIYNLALAQFRAGDSAAALMTLRNAGSSEPDVVYLRGKAMESLGDSQGTNEIAAACHLDFANETFCVDASIAAMYQDKFVEALDLAGPALRRSPGSIVLLPIVALAQFRLGRYSDATHTYLTALQQAPTLDAAREGLGFLYYMTGNLELARATVEAGLRNPGADFYLAYLDGLILYRLAAPSRAPALAAVERAIRVNARFAPAYFLRGKIFMDQGNLAAALIDFGQAAKIDPKYPLPYYKMAQIYARQGHAADADSARRKFAALGSLREEEVLARQAQDVLLPPRR